MENNGIEDGFHWEEWRGGKLFAYGWHNGTTPSGEDATADHVTIMRTIMDDEFDRSYKGEV